MTDLPTVPADRPLAIFGAKLVGDSFDGGQATAANWRTVKQENPYNPGARIVVAALIRSESEFRF